MNTNEKQIDARSRKQRLNNFAKQSGRVALVALLIVVILFLTKSVGELICAFIVAALSSGACGLYVATSEYRIKRAAGTLFGIGVAVSLLFPFAARRWGWNIEASFALNLLLNFSLLCLTGAAVALLRNSFGNVKYIEGHDTVSAILLALLLGGSAYFKVHIRSFEQATGLADLCLVIAGVVIGAMFEKERSKRRQEKRDANGNQ